MSYVVEKGIPIPPPNNQFGVWPRYPWADMLPGDSVFVSGDLRRVRFAVKGFVKRSRRRGDGLVMRTKTVVEEGVTGIRVWRVA